MNPAAKHTYAKTEVSKWPIPNHWDAVALLLVLAIILALGYAASTMLGSYQPGQAPAITLDPNRLPYYALHTVLRMFIALGCSLLFTFIFGTWAAKSPRAERIIIPMIDILQSVPVLGFLTISMVSFIALFPNSLFGAECAAIFAIFTAQVWNMTLSLYQSLRMVPKELKEAADVFQLSAWACYWRIEVPFAMPGLLWNTMMSMSSSWIFLVAAEAITVAHHEILLPGIGSYIFVAIQQANMQAIGYVILAMFIVIVLYDQLLFRPLVAWADKFKAEETASEVVAESWVLALFQRTRLFLFIGRSLSIIKDVFINASVFRKREERRRYVEPNLALRRLLVAAWYVLLLAVIAVSVFILFRFIFDAVPLHEVPHVFYLGLITAIRVMILIVISSLIWVPIGVWIGLNPRVSQIVQPVAQFLAAFPAYLLFPLVVLAIIKYKLNVNIWTSPLMILGTQWYILFNVIAGTMALPKNLRQAAGTINVKGWLWWKRLILPGIFPYYVTGAITAAGGAWNISIIAEAVSWGNIHLYATGIGAYIAKTATQGDFQRETLAIVIMSLYVLVINRFIWRPLYNMAERRFQL